MEKAMIGPRGNRKSEWGDEISTESFFDPTAPNVNENPPALYDGNKARREAHIQQNWQDDESLDKDFTVSTGWRLESSKVLDPRTRNLLALAIMDE